MSWITFKECLISHNNKFDIAKNELESLVQWVAKLQSNLIHSLSRSVMYEVVYLMGKSKIRETGNVDI